MSSEPERDIEKQIRSYAEKRGEEAGDRFAMHPATRQDLHREAAEAFPPETAKSPSFTVLQANEAVSFWTLFKRQFALLCMFAIVLSAAGIAWLKYGRPAGGDLAQAGSAEKPKEAAPQRSRPLEIVDLGERTDLEPAPPATPQPAETLPESPATAVVSSPPRPAPARTEAAPAPSPPRTTETVATPAPPPLTAPDPARPSQQFVNETAARTYRRNFNSPPPVELLATFQVQQVGRQILIVDADGSIFAGEILPPSNGSASLDFKAQGNSRALNRMVTITGRLSPAKSADRPPLADLRVSNEARLPLDRLLIDARVAIDEESRPISATPAPSR